MKKVVACLALTVLLSGCYSEEDIADAEDSILGQMRDLVYNCEQDLNYEGMLMDEGCLEDEFYYDGDFYNCETTPSFMVVDGDCILSGL
ncbi:hypothetical protein KKC44_00785 [Patescibacteria group bacterium]|nr:hypothetical protein [Patescibacteria group bacterium]MBU2259119.1 hypothetical protein [Patescibacteria group bacterium]